MSEQSTSDFPLPYPPDERPSPKERRWYRHWIWIFAAVGLALVALAGAYLWMHQPGTDTATAKRLFTYYYRDGKTVLWQGVEPFAADSPSFVHRVYDEIHDRFGPKVFEGSADWKITTTLDTSLQDVAKQQLAAAQQQMTRQGVQDAALMAQDVTTGQIVSWVVGFDDTFAKGDEDRLSTRTQAGTLILPFIYAGLIDNTNTGAGTALTDAKGPLPGYPCTDDASCLSNLDHRYLEKVTLRQALGGERLVPAVSAMTSTVSGDTSPGNISSIDKSLATIEHLMGGDNTYTCYLSGDPPYTRLRDFDKPTQCYGAAALGNGAYAAPQDIVGAYATLSNNGERLMQTAILTMQRNDKVVLQWKAYQGSQAVKADTAYIMDDILADPNASYLAKKDVFTAGSNKVSTMVGFTGDASSAGTVQYSSKYAVGLWAFGGQDPSQTIKGFSEVFALPAVTGWLAAAHQGKNYPDRERPSGIQTLVSPVIQFSSGSALPGPSPATDLYPSWYK